MTSLVAFNKSAREHMSEDTLRDWRALDSYCFGSRNVISQARAAQARQRLVQVDDASLIVNNSARNKRLRETRGAHRNTTKLLKRIGRAHKERNQPKLCDAVTAFFNSYHAKLVAYLFARDNMKKAQRPHLYALPHYASELDPYALEFEEARLTLKLKKHAPKIEDRTYRLITSFGIHHRAREQLVLMVLRQCLPLPEDDTHFGTAGRGKEQAVDAVIEKLHDDRLQFVAEYDIENFFPSIGEGVGCSAPENALLAQLPFLPRAVLESTVLLSGIIAPTLSMPGLQAHSRTLFTRTGVPQGSAVSSYLAEVIVHGIMTDAETLRAHRCEWMSYVDNMLVFGEDRDDVNGQLKPLDICARSSPFGDFRLSMSQPTRHKEDGFVFLGYYFEHCNGEDGENYVFVDVSKRNQTKFREKLNGLLRRYRPTSFSSRQYDHDFAATLHQALATWCNSFRRAPEVEDRAYAILRDALDNHPRAEARLAALLID